MYDDNTQLPAASASPVEGLVRDMVLGTAHIRHPARAVTVAT